MNIKELEDNLYRIGIEKFEKELKIESIEHQLDMSLYRKENGEAVDYLWLNKAKFKHNMLKIELKELNLKFDRLRKEVDAYYKSERTKRNVRLERVFMNLIRDDYGDEMFYQYLGKAHEQLNYIEGRTDDKVICRMCGNERDYGTMKWYSGHTCCPECFDEMKSLIKDAKENDYDTYVKGLVYRY